MFDSKRGFSKMEKMSFLERRIPLLEGLTNWHNERVLSGVFI